MGSAIDKNTRECDGLLHDFPIRAGLCRPLVQAGPCNGVIARFSLASRSAEKFVWAAGLGLGRLAAAVVGHAGPGQAQKGEKKKWRKKRNSQVVVARTAGLTGMNLDR
jgi:hypothetical protein